MKLLFFAILVVLSSCEDYSYQKEIKTESAEELKQSAALKIIFDTSGLYQAPIKILNSKINTLNDFRDITFTYQNISPKSVSGIKFSWYVLDAFNKPANVSSAIDGYGGGFDDNGLPPGDSATANFSMGSINAKKITLVWPTEVAFDDDTKWILKK